MTYTISVVTPAYRPVPQYLTEAYQSLCRQDLPAGWEWQWLVQEDGQTGEVAAMLPDDPRISAGRGRPGGGSAATRGAGLQDDGWPCDTQAAPAPGSPRLAGRS